jgi:hypothetical protein
VRFSRVKRLFFPRVYGESEAALYSRLPLAYHASMPQARISSPNNALFGAEKGDIGLQKAYFWDINAE